MCSNRFKAAERLANISDLRLTLPATDHTPKDRLSGDSRRETTHTKDTISPPAPDAPALGVEPPNERQVASPPEPKNLNLTDDHLRPVLARATTGEPPYPQLHPSLTRVQQDDLSFQPIFPQQDHPNFNQETRAGGLSPLLLPAANEHSSTDTFDTFFDSHFGPWPEHIGWSQGHPHSKRYFPDRRCHSTTTSPMFRTSEAWVGSLSALRKVGHVT
jgi:hypothetical protein